MTWADKLSRDEILEHIEVFREHPDFVQSRNSYLQSAVYAKDLQLVEALLKAGAGPDWVSDTGETFLHYLTHEYQVTRTSQGPLVLQLATLLLTYGADPEMVGAGNWRAVDRCIYHHIDEMRDLLVQFGANPTLREYV
jgi:hypothetical protein